MTPFGQLQVLAFIALLLVAVKPLGAYMAAVYEGRRTWMSAAVGGIERLIYRSAGIDPAQEHTWRGYSIALLAFNAIGLGAFYLLLRVQQWLPLNPQALPAVPADLAFNTAVSFVTNTDWQSYGGENTLSALSQMLGAGVQNFLSAATGMAVLAALARGLIRRETDRLGNFWVDLVRGTLYILLPLSAVLALALAQQGVVQSFAPPVSATLLSQPTAAGKAGAAASPGPVAHQQLPLGPVASQVAIKQLGTNGGGYYNANSAHPFENPTPLSNLLEMLAILLIPAALCYTFGRMVNDTRQGWALLVAMMVIFVPLTIAGTAAEQSANPTFATLGVDERAADDRPGGNMEGKELRFGIAGSTIWAAATTAASNGSVNSMHDAYTPLGGMVPLFLIELSEVVFGGVGSGLYGMLMYVIVAVFIAGLMVGRTPEYLGKKIEAYEIKMACLVLLVPPVLSLLGTALSCVLPAATAATGNPGPHGFSELLYAFSSAGNNNGSAFGGLSTNTPYYNFALAIIMWLSRFWSLIPVLAIAGSLAAKRPMATTSGTLPTHTPLFVAMLVGTVLLVGVLNFVPALALGPVVEQLMLHRAVVQP